ncbi:MAG: Acetyltransferase domain [Nitrospirae bacterium]|nr:Acetyltransferase domain [Nitrospirota bacterium]
MFYVNVSISMKDDNLKLRPLRIFDGPFIHRGLKDEIGLRTNRLSRQTDSSWFSVWWWIKKTYRYSFCIEVDSKPIGFIGLYNVAHFKSADISLVIFDETLRRQGYGTRSFKLFVQSLRRQSVMKKIFITVKTDNHRALSFWKKLGFSETRMINDRINMSMDLNSYKEGYK